MSRTRVCKQSARGRHGNSCLLFQKSGKVRLHEGIFPSAFKEVFGQGTVCEDLTSLTPGSSRAACLGMSEIRWESLTLETRAVTPRYTWNARSNEVLGFPEVPQHSTDVPAAPSPAEGAPPRRPRVLPTLPSPVAPGFLPGVGRHHGFIPHPAGAGLLVPEGAILLGEKPAVGVAKGLGWWWPRARRGVHGGQRLTARFFCVPDSQA